MFQCIRSEVQELYVLDRVNRSVPSKDFGRPGEGAPHRSDNRERDRSVADQFLRNVVVVTELVQIERNVKDFDSDLCIFS